MKATGPSPKFYTDLEREEGCVLHPYLDTAGVPTIGIGTTMYPDTGRKVTMRDAPITRNKAVYYMQLEAFGKSQSLNVLTRKVSLNQCQYDSLLSFMYNVGVGALQSSRLLRWILSGMPAQTMTVEQMDDRSVADYFRMHNMRAVPLVVYYFAIWCKVTVDRNGQKIKVLDHGLIARRLREAALFQKPCV